MKWIILITLLMVVGCVSDHSHPALFYGDQVDQHPPTAAGDTPVPEVVCDLNITYWNFTMQEKTCTDNCYGEGGITVRDVIKYRNKTETDWTSCRIEYGDEVLRYGDKDWCCLVVDDKVKCDVGTQSKEGDGNSDCVFQSGETVKSFKFSEEDGIEVDTVMDGDIDKTAFYKGDIEKEITTKK